MNQPSQVTYPQSVLLLYSIKFLSSLRVQFLLWKLRGLLETIEQTPTRVTPHAILPPIMYVQGESGGPHCEGVAVHKRAWLAALTCLKYKIPQKQINGRERETLA
jgi:hypothetical protein